MGKPGIGMEAAGTVEAVVTLNMTRAAVVAVERQWRRLATAGS